MSVVHLGTLGWYQPANNLPYLGHLQPGILHLRLPSNSFFRYLYPCKFRWITKLCIGIKANLNIIKLQFILCIVSVKVTHPERLIWSVQAVQDSSLFHIAIGEAKPKANIQIIGTSMRIKLVLKGGSWGQTMSLRLSNAITVILSVETNKDVAWSKAANGHAAG